MIDIEKLKALAAVPGDIGRNDLAFWLADHANEIIRELEEARKDAERYAWVIAFDDNAEFVLSMVLNHGPDHKNTIDMEIDREMERQSARQQKG